MSSRNIILEELKSLNSGLLIKDLQEPVFSLPENYFESFADEVLKKIKSQEAQSVMDELKGLSPMLAGISRKLPYAVPENYFSEITEEIPVLIGNEEIPAVLAEAGKEMPYHVPQGYFAGLADKMLNSVAKKPAKVISMQRRFVRMAVAAVIAGIMVVSGFMYFNQSKVDPNTNPEQWLTKNLKGVSGEEMDSFIETADISSEEPIISNTTEVRQMLSDVSVNEMDAFLAQIPTDDDELMVIN